MENIEEISEHSITEPENIVNEIINEQPVLEFIEGTREYRFASHKFEWIKTERAGEVCIFRRFENEGGIEYTCFSDNTRIRTDLIGDVVLMHLHDSEILGQELKIPTTDPGPNYSIDVPKPATYTPFNNTVSKIEKDPVISILEKAKKKVEKISLTLSVKIPSVELYNVIKENFDNAEDVLLESVMEQLHEKLLKEAVKREIQNIYSSKKKKI